MTTSPRSDHVICPVVLKPEHSLSGHPHPIRQQRHKVIFSKKPKSPPRVTRKSSVPHGWVGIKPCSPSAARPCCGCIAGVGHRSRQNIWHTCEHTCTLPPQPRGPGQAILRHGIPSEMAAPLSPHAPSSSKVSPPSSPSSPVPPPSTCGSPLGPDIPPRPPAPRRRPHGAPVHARGLQPMGGQGALRVTQAGAAANSVVNAEGAGCTRAGGRSERRWAGGNSGGQPHFPRGFFLKRVPRARLCPCTPQVSSGPPRLPRLGAAISTKRFFPNTSDAPYGSICILSVRAIPSQRGRCC